MGKRKTNKKKSNSPNVIISAIEENIGGKILEITRDPTVISQINRRVYGRRIKTKLERMNLLLGGARANKGEMSILIFTEDTQDNLDIQIKMEEVTFYCDHLDLIDGTQIESINFPFTHPVEVTICIGDLQIDNICLNPGRTIVVCNGKNKDVAKLYLLKKAKWNGSNKAGWQFAII